MKPWQSVATAATDAGLLELRQRGHEFLIVVAGRVLMSSTARRSEQALATLALDGRAARRVLIGGLGMGFTLRAALDCLAPDARVTVAELNADVVAWCKGPLAAVTNSAVTDPRVTIEIGDVARVIAGAAPASYDAIVLDLYEGPYADDAWFGAAALARTRTALAPGGVLAVWSEDSDPRFARRLATAGFTAKLHRIGGRGFGRHAVYIANC